jgi:ADP-ribose pyrophosphatase
MKPWKKLTESVVLKNRWWTYKRDELELPSGKKGEYHYVHTHGSSMIVPIMGNGKLLAVKQYRYLAGRDSIEFPCGSVKEGSTHDETARHELAEETGYSSNRMLMVGEFNPYNGVTDEMCRVYSAQELRHADGTPDDTEEFEVLLLDANEIDDHIRSGTIWDGMTIVAWHLVRSRIEM